MKCPHCGHRFALTWRRYFDSPTGIHACPACRRLSRLRYPSAGAALQNRMAIGLPAFFATALIGFFLGGDRGLTLGYLFSCVAFLPLDRFLAVRFRVLRK